MFNITDEQRMKLQEWLDKHQQETGHIKAYAGAIGGVLTYKFTPTSIGVVTRVCCGFCKEECDISDYEEW